MKKVFISQPMRGKTDEEVIRDREKAIKTIREKMGDDVKIIESFMVRTPKEAKALWHLGESIKLLSNADYIFLVDGWENARGCRIEYLCAEEYGIKIFEVI